VPGDPRDYRQEHPSRPLLVVEFASPPCPSTGRKKGSLYARAGVPDHRIVNLVDSQLEVHRTPALASAAPFGWAFRDVERLGSHASVSPLALPGIVVAVADLLP
jgi:Uma2 family endonuclease